jgi:hypothetical protein
MSVTIAGLGIESSTTKTRLYRLLRLVYAEYVYSMLASQSFSSFPSHVDLMKISRADLRATFTCPIEGRILL